MGTITLDLKRAPNLPNGAAPYLTNGSVIIRKIEMVSFPPGTVDAASSVTITNPAWSAEGQHLVQIVAGGANSNVGVSALIPVDVVEMEL